MKRRKPRLIWALLILSALALGGCQTPAGRSAGEVIDDATITTKVKAKLLDESILRGFAISVATFESEVTLTGAVDTAAQKDRATAITRSVTGVRRVHNLLKVR